MASDQQGDSKYPEPETGPRHTMAAIANLAISIPRLLDVSNIQRAAQRLRPKARVIAVVALLPPGPPIPMQHDRTSFALKALPRPKPGRPWLRRA